MAMDARGRVNKGSDPLKEGDYKVGLRGGSPAPTLRSPRKPPCAVICPTTRFPVGF